MTSASAALAAFAASNTPAPVPFITSVPKSPATHPCDDFDITFELPPPPSDPQAELFHC